MVSKQPVTAQVVIKEETKDTSKIKEVQDVLIDKNPPNADKGEIGFNTALRVPNVYGPYSSMEIGISIKGPGDPEKFEAFVEKYIGRASDLLRHVVNQTLLNSGQKPYFGEVDETKKE